MTMNRTGRKRRTHVQLAERLEGRCLLSGAGVLDSTFGTGGSVGGYLAGNAQSDGTIVASHDSGSLSLLNPDGSYDSTYAPPSAHSGSSGKSLRLSNDTLMRSNSDGTPDTSFGNSGTVSDFVSGTGAAFFHPQSIAAQGSKILVAGEAGNPGLSSDYLAIERLNADGSIDGTFGTNGIGRSAANSGAAAQAYYIAIGPPTGSLYIAGEMNNHPGVARFTASGQPEGQFFAPSLSDDRVYALAFQGDGKTLVLTAGTDQASFSLYRANADLSPDGTFGTSGAVKITAPVGAGTVTKANPKSVTVGPDGRIFVGGAFEFSDHSDASYTFAFEPGTAADSATVSGQVTTDTTTTSTITTSVSRFDAAAAKAIKSPLAYWQVYADLNNNGTFDWGEPTAFADKNGMYQLSGLKPGSYRIREVARPGYLPTGNGEYFDVTVAARQNLSSKDFSNHRAALVTGHISVNQASTAASADLSGFRVYADLNGDGAWEADEPSAVTDSNGAYNLTLPAGDYHIRQVPKDGYTTPSAGSAVYDLVVADGQTASGKDFSNNIIQPPETTPPPTGNPPAVSSNPPTVADLIATVAADRLAVTDAIQQRNQTLHQLLDKLHTDSATYKFAISQTRVSRHSRSGSSGSTPSDLYTELTSLNQTVLDDQHAIVTFRRSDLAGIFAAKHKLASDLHALNLARRHHR